MIVDCLQKEPSKRPSAAELLKHPFFKKAKDKKYLQQTLVAIGPSLETRVQKVFNTNKTTIVDYYYLCIIGIKTATRCLWSVAP